MTGEGAYASYPSLRDRAVFLTGGATGLGAAMVRELALQGARVAFVDVEDEAGNALVDEFAGVGLCAPIYQHCDIRDVTALRAAITAAAAVVGPIEVLVNNAANDERHAVEKVSVDYWDEKMSLNLRPQFFATQAVLPMMRSLGGGSVINLGSIIWRANFSGVPAYSTAKAAIEGLTRALARDLGRHRIRVNCVVPGWAMTQRQLTHWVTPEAEEIISRSQCLPDKVMPGDVARMVLWLAADDSRMCSAQTWVVDGGWT